MRFPLLIIHVGHDGGDEVADFLDFVLAPGSDEVACEGLGSEQRGPGDSYPRLGAERFPKVQCLYRELDQELVGGPGGAGRGRLGL